MEFLGDICISNVTVISGVRPNGRTTDHSIRERAHSGFLYIWNGEARFWAKNDRQTTVKDRELLFIPKGYRYKMQYTAPSTTFVLINLEMLDQEGNSKTLFDEIEVLAKDDSSGRIAGIMANLELCSAS